MTERTQPPDIEKNDLTVSILRRPTFAAQTVEDSLDIVVHGVDMSLVYDGIFRPPLDGDLTTFSPSDSIDELVRGTAREAGFDVERYAEANVSLPAEDSNLAAVEFKLRVTPAAGETVELQG